MMNLVRPLFTGSAFRCSFGILFLRLSLYIHTSDDAFEVCLVGWLVLWLLFFCFFSFSFFPSVVGWGLWTLFPALLCQIYCCLNMLVGTCTSCLE